MRFIYVTDLHGNRKAVEQVLERATQKQADAIVFGGDLTPNAVAAKLAVDYDDETRGGELLPWNALKRDPITGSFHAGLLKLRELNTQHGKRELEEMLRRQGYMIYEVSNHFYELESLLLEQLVLEKLWSFFVKSEKITLSEEELQIVRECVVEWMRECEMAWSREQREFFLCRCRAAFRVDHSDFAMMAPSRHLEYCLLFAGADQSQIAELLHSVREVLGRFDSSGAAMFKEAFWRFQDDFLNSPNYQTLIEGGLLSQLAAYSSVTELRRQSESEEVIRRGQAEFLEQFFLPAVCGWKAGHPGAQVFAMLGNDDLVENDFVMQRAHDQGALTYLCDRVGELSPGLMIAGYSFVEGLPEGVTYRNWERSGREMLVDLTRLQGMAGGAPLVWCIHQPPLGYLDNTDGGNVGSRTVRDFLLQTKPPLALFGHIHEATRLARTATVRLGDTLCVNPGAEHHKSLDAVIVNTADFTVERIL